MPTTTRAWTPAADPDHPGRNHPAIRAYFGRKASGVYMIADRRTGQILYVGESHTGRLYDTLTRHFREWRIPRGRGAHGRLVGGTQYDREKVDVAFMELPADRAEAVQYDLIRELSPRDNTEDCHTCSDLPPF
jgi:hypothetical protein